MLSNKPLTCPQRRASILLSVQCTALRSVTDASGHQGAQDMGAHGLLVFIVAKSQCVASTGMPRPPPASNLQSPSVPNHYASGLPQSLPSRVPLLLPPPPPCAAKPGNQPARGWALVPPSRRNRTANEELAGTQVRGPSLPRTCYWPAPLLPTTTKPLMPPGAA